MSSDKFGMNELVIGSKLVISHLQNNLYSHHVNSIDHSREKYVWVEWAANLDNNGKFKVIYQLRNPFETNPLFYIQTNLLGAHKIIGATKHVILSFFYGICITTINSFWNYEKDLCINNLNLRIYLVVIAWIYSRFKLNTKRTNIGLVTLPLYSLGKC
jgi:hypothetical protein